MAFSATAYALLSTPYLRILLSASQGNPKEMAPLTSKYAEGITSEVLRRDNGYTGLRRKVSISNLAEGLNSSCRLQETLK